MDAKEFTQSELALIRERCAKQADDPSFDHMIYLCKTYGLDPLLKEIWCVTDNKSNHRIQVARDGFMSIANRSAEFNGMHSDTVCEGDYYALNPDGTVIHQYGMSRGNIIGAYCLVFRKDRAIPSYFFAPYREYASNTPIWRSYPTSMIIKVAESMALKRAFSLSGLTSDVEMDAITDPIPASQPAQLAAPVQQVLPAPAPVAQLPAPAQTVQPVQVEQAKVIDISQQQQQNDVANFMAQANGAPPPAVFVPMTNKQRATVQDLLRNPAIPEDRRKGAEEFFATPNLSKDDAQSGIDRLMDIVYPRNPAPQG